MPLLRAKPNDVLILADGPGPIHTWAGPHRFLANAGMFETATGRVTGALVAGRKVVNRFPTNWPLFRVANTGQAAIYEPGTWKEYWDLDRTKHAVSCAPLLVWGGNATDVKAELTRSNMSAAAIQPEGRIGRTAIGVDAAGNVLLAVEASATLTEMQQRLIGAGAVAAINLDGGGSSVLYRDGKRVVGQDVRKYPSAIALTKVIEESRPVQAPLQHYPITESLLTLGKDHNRPGTPLTVQGVVMHDVSNDETTARNNRDYFNDHPEADASAHLIADWNEIIECIPWQKGRAEQAWHAGATANSKYVGIELCTTKDPAKFAASFERWCYAAARVLVEYSIGTGPGLWSHKGVAEKWEETNHTDPYGYLAQWGKSWQDVLDRVEEYMAFIRGSDQPPVTEPAIDWQSRALAAEAKLAQIKEIIGG